MSVAAAPTMMYSPMGSPRIHAASGQMSSPRAMSTRLPSMSPRSRGVNGGSSSARLGSLSARSLSGPSGRLLITPRLEQTPRHQADFGSPLGGALPTNPLVSLTLSMDGAVVTRLLIELRHDDSPNTCRPARSRLMGLCGTKLAYTGRLGGTLVTTDPTAVGPSTSVETVQADSPPKLGHWGRGVLSAKADGTLAILLDPKHADLREYRPIGQVLRGYEGLEYIETMSQPTGYRGAGYVDAPASEPAASVEITEASLVRGLPGEKIPSPNTQTGSNGDVRTGGFSSSGSPIKPHPPLPGTPRTVR